MIVWDGNDHSEDQNVRETPGNNSKHCMDAQRETPHNTKKCMAARGNADATLKVGDVYANGLFLMFCMQHSSLGHPASQLSAQSANSK